ncbi:MAG: VanZ family protein [Oscillibacter sp.]|nr:VanZ family protein [Oscillibacter sp.]
MGERKKTWVLLGRNIAWAAIIFVLCALPSENIPDPHLNIPHLDKVVHFGMFFIMAVLLCNELEYQTRFRLRKIYMITVSIAFLYGGTIEILQQYCFERSGDVWDLVADIFGAVIGCWIYPHLKRMIANIKGGKKK